MDAVLTPARVRRNAADAMAGWPFAACFAALFLVAALPVIATAYPPLFDYPNHLARMYVLAGPPASSPLARFYAPHWVPLPNLAMDLIIPELARIMPVPVAGRVFILLTMLMLAGGTAALHRVVHHRRSATPLLAFLFLYNKVLFWGFLNYLFGLGLAFFCLAGWIALHRRHAALRIAAGTVFACAVYFAHLEAVGLYGLMVMAYEAGAAWREQTRWGPRLGQMIVAGVPFLLPLGILITHSQGLDTARVAFAPWGHKIDNWGNLVGTESLPLDAVCLLAIVAGTILGFVRGWLRLAPSLGLPLIVLCVAYAAMPTSAFTSNGADHRMPMVVAFLFVAALRWTPPDLPIARRFYGGALLVFLLEIAGVTVAWQHSDAVYRRLVAVLDRLPPGSRVAVAFPPRALHLNRTPAVHFPLEAVIRRGAFVTTLFAYPTQQPIRVLPPYDQVAAGLQPEAVWAWFVDHKPGINRAALRNIDDVVFLNVRPVAVPASPSLTEVAGTPRFKLYRLNHLPAAPAPPPAPR
jgi:hypothetical protein